MQVLSVKRGTHRDGKAYAVLEVAGLHPDEPDGHTHLFFLEAIPDRRAVYGLPACADCPNPATCQRLTCEGGRLAVRAILREAFAFLNPDQLATLPPAFAATVVRRGTVPGKRWDGATQQIVDVAPPADPQPVAIDLSDV